MESIELRDEIQFPLSAILKESVGQDWSDENWSLIARNRLGSIEAMVTGGRREPIGIDWNFPQGL